MRLSDKAALELQRTLSFLLLILFGTLCVAMFRLRYRYSAENLRAVRDRFAAIRRQHDGAMLLCTNHLTLIDSIVQGVMLRPLWQYLTSPSALAWNLPERKNFNHALSWRVACYLGRCIPVTRGGSPEQSKRTQAQMQHVLERGDIISIFPEGKRSRSGLVDDEDYSYATGQLLKLVPGATVVCIYLRGRKAGGFRDWPVNGERFYMDVEVMEPRTELKGLRAVRDTSRQIVAHLKAMEARCLAGQ
ncbi:MAG: 1-acyl-sn-glycerol-3-phosphate acyltransferase [Pseudomonadota bacterium]